MAGIMSVVAGIVILPLSLPQPGGLLAVSSFSTLVARLLALKYVLLGTD